MESMADGTGNPCPRRRGHATRNGSMASSFVPRLLGSIPWVPGDPRADLPVFDVLVELVGGLAGALEARAPGVVVGELPQRDDGQLVARFAVDLGGERARGRPFAGVLELE